MSFLRKKERKKERRASFVQYCPLFIMQVMGAPKQPLCGALCTLSLSPSFGRGLSARPLLVSSMQCHS